MAMIRGSVVLFWFCAETLSVPPVMLTVEPVMYASVVAGWLGMITDLVREADQVHGDREPVAPLSAVGAGTGHGPDQRRVGGVDVRVVREVEG